MATLVLIRGAERETVFIESKGIPRSGMADLRSEPGKV